MDIRQDYLTGKRALISGERSLRPQFFEQKAGLSVSKAKCPFCGENQDLLPEIIYKSSDGRITVCPNKYPALGETAGIHELIIDSDSHFEKFYNYSAENICRTFHAIKDRFAAHKDNDKLEHIQIFKNDGPKSGASIPHSHWQIIGLPFAPEKQIIMGEKFSTYFADNGIGYIENLVNNKDLLVYENETAFLYIPYAGIYTYNVNIAPKKRHGNICSLSDDEMIDIAECLKHALNILCRLLKDFSFNICLQSEPLKAKGQFHMFFDIIPRVGNFAGFELGCDSYINSVLPEKLAENMRKILTSEVI